MTNVRMVDAVDGDIRITTDVIRDITSENDIEETFYVFDVEDVVRKYETWKRKLPRVRPFYAVKCNPHPSMLKTIACLGIGFDCATKKEIEDVLALGVDQRRIIYANPTKLESHLKYAAAHGVDLMTVDGEYELEKIARFYPQSRLLLRIRADARFSGIALGTKFGCDAVYEAPHLLQTAKKLKLNVVGVCFHVGYLCGEPAAYSRAIRAAHKLFECGQNMGFDMTVLDIGGGYSGTKNAAIDEIADMVNDALDECFPDGDGVDVIAEPGTFFAASAFTMASVIYAKRILHDDSRPGGPANVFFITAGIYGCMRGPHIDNFVMHPIPLRKVADNDDKNDVLMPCLICGPTCHQLDIISTEKMFLNMAVGDWIVFENMGAYTLAMSSSSNGFPTPPVYTVLKKSLSWRFELLLKTSDTVTFRSKTSRRESIVTR